MNGCKYKLLILKDRRTILNYNRFLCNAYAKSKRPDGLHWAHYPVCTNKNCPLRHPELLEGAVLKEQGK